jgi:hypothetical protein
VQLVALPLLGILIALAGSSPVSAVSLIAAPDRIEIVNQAQKVAFARNAAGRYAPATFVRSGDAWLPLFDGGSPILRGPCFDLVPTRYEIVANGADRVAVLLSGTHDGPAYDWDLLVEATAASPLIRFRITCRLPAQMILRGLEPTTALSLQGGPPEVEVSQGPGNIAHGSAEKQWGNSFPAAYMWSGGREAAVFFCMTPMTWMSPRNIFRFHDCRVQVFSEAGRTDLGMRVVKRNFHEVPPGNLVVEFFLYSGPRTAKPTRLEALHTLVRTFAELHPATAPLPENRVDPGQTSWGFVAGKTAENLRLEDVTWADVPLPGGAWRDEPLFPENTRSELRVSPDYAIGSRCDPGAGPGGLRQLWDFSCVNNCLASWIVWNRLHPDPAEHEFLEAKVRGLPLFYDPAARMLRWAPGPARQQTADKEMSWQNFTFSLETMKVFQGLAPENFDPAVAGKFLLGTRGLIELARHEDYIFPQWFDPRRKRALPQADVPELGIVYEPWQAGTYAWLMHLAYETTGETAYLDEAKAAILRLFSGRPFTVTNRRYSIAYADPIDFPITEVFGNAWGVAAAEKVYQHTGDRQFRRRSDDFLNVLLRMTYWYESQLADDRRDRAVHNAGLFRNHSGAMTGSPWETIEAYLAMTVYLKHRQPAWELLLRLFNLQRINGFYFYPPFAPEAAVACRRLDEHPARYLPIEDFYTMEHGGTHGAMGRAVYMSSLALWNYVLYEAFAASSDREVMVLNLDAVEGIGEALASVERTFLVYNPTDSPRAFTLSMSALAGGDYRLAVQPAAGEVRESDLSAAELSRGVPLSLDPGRHVRIVLRHSDRAKAEALGDVRAAQNRLSHAYQRLQQSAEGGLSPKVLRGKESFLAAMAEYRRGRYAAARIKAEEIVAAFAP